MGVERRELEAWKDRMMVSVESMSINGCITETIYGG